MKRTSKTKYQSDKMTIKEIQEQMGPNTTVKVSANGRVVLTQIEEKIVRKKELSLHLDVEQQFIQVYLGFYENLIRKGKSTSAQSILTYVLKYKMSNNNEFLVNTSFYEEYSKYLEQLTGKSHSDRYTRKVLQEMVDDGFFIRLERGLYKVNPEGFWCASKESRNHNLIRLANDRLIDADVVSKEKHKYIGTEQENGEIY